MTDDVDVLLAIASVLYPGCMSRSPDSSVVQISVEEPSDAQEQALVARGRFQTVVGTMRVLNAGGLPAWHTVPGRRAAGGGSATAFALQASAAMNRSHQLRHALWLNGAQHLAAPHYGLIMKCAGLEFHGESGIRTNLQITGPMPAVPNGPAKVRSLRVRARAAVARAWTVPQLEQFSADLLRRWIALYSAPEPPSV